MRRSTASAEDSDYHHYHDGDHSSRHYDYKEHVAIQGRSGTSVGTVAACKSLRREKGVVYYTEETPIKSQRCPSKTLRIVRISRTAKLVCLLGFQAKCLLGFLSFADRVAVQLVNL